MGRRDNANPGQKRVSATQILARRKNIMRQIQGMDPEEDAEKIEKLQQVADDLLKQAKQGKFDIKDAYGLALTK